MFPFEEVEYTKNKSKLLVKYRPGLPAEQHMPLADGVRKIAGFFAVHPFCGRTYNES